MEKIVRGYCHVCRTTRGKTHHPSCNDRGNADNEQEWDQGWDDARCKGIEDPPEGKSKSYYSGFHRGVVAREEAANTSWWDTHD